MKRVEPCDIGMLYSAGALLGCLLCSHTARCCSGMVKGCQCYLKNIRSHTRREDTAMCISQAELNLHVRFPKFYLVTLRMKLRGMGQVQDQHHAIEVFQFSWKLQLSTATWQDTLSAAAWAHRHFCDNLLIQLQRICLPQSNSFFFQ